jgi:glycerol kinase
VTHRTSYLLAIDQGTTSTRAVAFTLDGMPAATHQVPFKQIYPRDGWVEHDAEEIWSTVEACVNAVVAEIGGVDQVAALGITNQRETTVVWDRATGAPVSHAIVWQDRRGAEICEALRNSEQEEIIQSRTGLIPDSYFSATKIQWLLDSQPGLRDCAARGDLACGTIDSFLLWRLTGGSTPRMPPTHPAQ